MSGLIRDSNLVNFLSGHGLEVVKDGLGPAPAARWAGMRFKLGSHSTTSAAPRSSDVLFNSNIGEVDMNGASEMRNDTAIDPGDWCATRFEVRHNNST